MTWHRPRGTTARDGWDVVVEPDSSGWEHTALYAAELAPGETRTLPSAGFEYLVVPLAGAMDVTSEGWDGSRTAALAGRDSVFAGPTDVAYVPAGSTLTLHAPGPARVAVAAAVTGKRDRRQEFRHVIAAEVPVELRGAGQASREVRNLGVPGVLDADSLIVCEVLTPAGGWSSWPPHKHDEERAGEETQLEEIYYFEVGGGGVGYLHCGGIGVTVEVASGDVVQVPHGWHGPAMAPPGYDLYYLNVMAGPGAERAWLICDHPDHAWVRDTWPDAELDPRLPFGGPR